MHNQCRKCFLENINNSVMLFLLKKILKGCCVILMVGIIAYAILVAIMLIV